MRIRSRCQGAGAGVHVASLLMVGKREGQHLPMPLMSSETWTTSSLSLHIHSLPFPLGHSCEVFAVCPCWGEAPILTPPGMAGAAVSLSWQDARRSLCSRTWLGGLSVESRNQQSRVHGMFLYNP